VARRLAALECDLVGRKLAPGIGETVSASHLAPLTPIDDVRAAAAYRSDAALALVARSLETLAAP
jgi:CO/xanthine dehydrogenase FAD-binding subunit